MNVTYYEPQAAGTLSAATRCDGGGPRERLDIPLAAGATASVWLNEYAAGRLAAQVGFRLDAGSTLRLAGAQFDVDGAGPLRVTEIRGSVADRATGAQRLVRLGPGDEMEGGSYVRRNPEGRNLGRFANEYEVALSGALEAKERITLRFPAMRVNGAPVAPPVVPFQRRSGTRLVVNC